MVSGFGNWQAGVFSQKADYLLREALRGIDTGSGRRSTLRNFCHSRKGRIDSLNAVADLCGVAGKLLAEGYRGGIHQVGTSWLHVTGPGLGLYL